MSSGDPVDQEPHFRDGPRAPDPSEHRAWKTLRRRGPVSEGEAAENSVWDEPAHSAELSGGTPDGALTYETWLVKRRYSTSVARTWGVTVALALAAGPWAVLGSFWGAGETPWGLLALIVFAPLVEETMKTAATTWVVEKRPFLFGSRVQIAVCCLGSGLAFAAIENLIYLNVYVPDPSPALVAWRWSVCMAMHAGCTFVAGLGLMRIWKRTMDHRTPPRLSLGAPCLVAAMAIHGAYNGAAILLEKTVLQF